ncbi:MAG TPA: two-component system response regulator [Planctomycetaceae bacterium]|nr:two-component system response regulator [Planctomycetaceae bacterium]HRF02413.1 response regulator [Pirellulaceae bacterium]
MTGASPRILISDDDRDLRETLGEYFLRRGMDVLYAEDGEQAIDVVERFPVHVMLLDFQMPKRDGLEVLEHLRTRVDLPNDRRRPACILMSARLDERLIERAMAAEAYRVQSKPFGLRQIDSLVGTALRERHGLS